MARDVSADVVVLIENKKEVPAEETLACLQKSVSKDFSICQSNGKRFQLFCRNSDLDLSESYSADRLTMRRVNFKETELLLGVVHIVDRGNWDPAHQSCQVQLLADEISRYEDKAGHSRTFLVGDFNMNPFDQIMNMAPGLNAMMTQKCVAREHRSVQGDQYRFFYNPMWGMFGDRTDGPAGTYYHTSTSNGLYGWNMLDQVLVRPKAIEWFDNVEILSAAGDEPLQTKIGRPRSDSVSDHFPILLRLR